MKSEGRRDIERGRKKDPRSVFSHDSNGCPTRDSSIESDPSHGVMKSDRGRSESEPMQEQSWTMCLKLTV